MDFIHDLTRLYKIHFLSTPFILKIIIGKVGLSLGSARCKSTQPRLITMDTLNLMPSIERDSLYDNNLYNNSFKKDSCKTTILFLSNILSFSNIHLGRPQLQDSLLFLLWIYARPEHALDICRWTKRTNSLSIIRFQNP